MTETMKAVTMHDFGNADALVLEDAPRPRPMLSAPALEPTFGVPGLVSFLQG